MSKANDFQVGGSHYKTPTGREHWDMVEEFNLDYFQGQITKYVMRWKDKNGLQDLQKARHFLDKYIEIATQREKRLQGTKLGISTEGKWYNESAEVPAAAYSFSNQHPDQGLNINPNVDRRKYFTHEGSNAFGSEPPSGTQLPGGKIPTSQF